MRFSVKVQYGLQALLELALNAGGGPVQISEIAADQKVPVKFLEQILLSLKRVGLVASVRGRAGGYVLAKRPGEISALNLIEALDGPIELMNKRGKKSAVIFEAFDLLESNLRQELAKLTLSDLALKARQKERAYTYNI